MVNTIHLVFLMCTLLCIHGEPLYNKYEKREETGETDYDKWMEEWDNQISQGFEQFMKEMTTEETKTRRKRQGDKDPMQSFLEEMQTNFDKEFEQFMKEMEAEYTDDAGAAGATKKRETPAVVKDRTTIATSAGRKDYNGGERVDSFEDFVISVDREMDGSFQQFLNDLYAGQEKPIKRETSRENKLFQTWKGNQQAQARQKYQLFVNENRNADGRRSSRDTEERSFPLPLTEQPGQVLTAATNELTSETNIEKPGQSKGEGKAEGSPSGGGGAGGGGLTDMLPAPIKDRVPQMAASAPESPTLFIGGFSVMMMPMPNGADMAQFMQSAPNFMSFMPTGRK